MSSLRALHGVWGHPMRQVIRGSDGVRGVFLRAPIKRGGLILSVPLRYCYLPWGLLPRGDPSRTAELSAKEAMHLRRCNRGKSLFPEFWTWAQRLSPDVQEERVSLSASASDEGRVFCVTLSPVEAALVVCVALRFFFGPAFGLPKGASVRRLCHANQVSPPQGSSEALAERYVASLPMELYLSHGVESLFTVEGHGAAEHACLEQLSYNLRDACLTWAATEQYRWMDENPSVLDSTLLAALYVVRARVLPVQLLSAVGAKRDREVEVFAPGLDMLNHAADGRSTATAAMAPSKGVLVVRAARDAHRGEEVTIDYGAQGTALATRYMLGANQTALGSWLDDATLL